MQTQAGLRLPMPANVMAASGAAPELDEACSVARALFLGKHVLDAIRVVLLAKKKDCGPGHCSMARYTGRCFCAARTATAQNNKNQYKLTSVHSSCLESWLVYRKRSGRYLPQSLGVISWCVVVGEQFLCLRQGLTSLRKHLVAQVPR